MDTIKWMLYAKKLPVKSLTTFDTIKKSICFPYTLLGRTTGGIPSLWFLACGTKIHTIQHGVITKAPWNYGTDGPSIAVSLFNQIGLGNLFIISTRYKDIYFILKKKNRLPNPRYLIMSFLTYLWWWVRLIWAFRVFQFLLMAPHSVHSNFGGGCGSWFGICW